MRLTKGRVLAQRFFDVADEVRLAEAKAILERTSRRMQFVSTASRVRMTQPPLEVHVAARPTGVEGLPACESFVRIYDLGAIAVTFEIPLPTPAGPEELITFAARLFDAEASLTAAARPIVDEILSAIASACTNAKVSDVAEEYAIFLVEGWEPPLMADELARELDVARLLLGETGKITEAERQHVIRQSFSYQPDEVVVLDWNSALIVDPRGARDVADVLELASMQLLELRAYDHLVGRSLARLYVELGSRREDGFRVKKYSKLSREVMRLFVDLTELTERFDNSLHIIGDTWLARIHRAAVQEFDIPRWRSQLEGKLGVLHQINMLLVDQINARNTVRLEGAIVALIVLEIFLALLKIV